MKIDDMSSPYVRMVIASLLSSILIALFLKEINDRNFLCFSNGKCVTTWGSGESFIVIPGKYYGLLNPDEYVSVQYGGVGGSFQTSIFLSSNPKYQFVVVSDIVKNNSNGKIYAVGGRYTEAVDMPTIKDELYRIETGIEFVGRGTIVERRKNNKNEIVIEVYEVFQNLYIPLLIILFVVAMLIFITEKHFLNNRFLKERLKIISIWSARVIGESIIVTIVDIALIATGFILFTI